MIHSCYLGDNTSFNSFEELCVHLISIHNKLPKNKETLKNPIIKKAILISTINNVQIQRILFENNGFEYLEKLT